VEQVMDVLNSSIKIARGCCAIASKVFCYEKKENALIMAKLEALCKKITFTGIGERRLIVLTMLLFPYAIIVSHL
jgi:hypothetical protein